MDLRRGFQVEVPAIVLPWGIDERQLRALLPSAHHVTDGYDTLDVVSLHGLRHVLGFHFEPRANGPLVELEFFRREPIDIAMSYADFERHLERTYGPPTQSAAGEDGFPTQRWLLDGAEVRHYVFDRFGLEEHVRMRAT